MTRHESFVRATGKVHVVRDRPLSATRASTFVTFADTFRIRGTHINEIIMPTVQQPRRGATRRVLKAAGLALGAVLVSSQAQGAYAADGAVTVVSTCNSATTQVNSEPNGDGQCACKIGYSDRQVPKLLTRAQLDLNSIADTARLGTT